MRKIELRTGDDDRFVAFVEIPPFPDHRMPHVVTWGSRLFAHRGARSGELPWAYDEVFAVASLTPPPGLPLHVDERGESWWLGTKLDDAPSSSPPVPVDWSAKTTLHGSDPNTDEHKAIDPATGMQRDYVVLSAAERAKGFVRPVRRAYVHVGKRPKHPLRDLTAAEAERYASEKYVKYETYSEGGSTSVVGRFWTAEDLASGCGATTTMGIALAETYAREPGFYGGTFCATCRAHFPVGADGEFTWEGSSERVGT